MLIIPTLWEGLGVCADYTDIVGKSGSYVPIMVDRLWEGVLIIPTLVGRSGRVC